MSQLETLAMEALHVNSLEALRELVKNDKVIAQTKLDAATPRIMKMLPTAGINNHTLQVYNETCEAYLTTPRNQGIINELITFMNRLPTGSSVLDLGCGPGRDTLFMTSNDLVFRASQMLRAQNGITTLETHPVPSKTFAVTGIDIAPQMVQIAFKQALELEKANKLAKFPKFAVGDFYDLEKKFTYLTTIGPQRFQHIPLNSFDGVWSCAALFTHTPKELIDVALQNVAKVLKKGGVFFSSYTARFKETGQYDKLLLSQTGRVKYFSHPLPVEISMAASRKGLKLAIEIQDDIFLSQFFVKK